MGIVVKNVSIILFIYGIVIVIGNVIGGCFGD